MTKYKCLGLILLVLMGIVYFINNLLNIDSYLNKNLTIKSGNQDISPISTIKSNTTIIGEEQATIDGKYENSITLKGLKNIEFKNIKFVNLANFTLKDSSNIKFENCIFDSFSNNGVVIENFNNVEFYNCTFSNIGNTNIDETWQGIGLYSVNGTNLKVRNNEFYNTYGHGSIFLTNTSFEIDNNKIHDTFFRGIELYQAGNIGTIRDNNIFNCGSINNTKSGEGCNGIFGIDASNVVIKNNKITDVLENGIEGNFKSVENNVITGTGIDMINHYTPSGEGIYIFGTGKIVGNIIKNSYGAGIKKYSRDTISDIDIINNYIENCINSDYAIDLNSERGYSNIKILDNTISNNKYCEGLRETSKVNVIVSNNSILKN
ncbi:MAG: right-handed parallel beta-helix repeat-containing protein [Clostridiaceae bacterium]